MQKRTMWITWFDPPLDDASVQPPHTVLHLNLSFDQCHLLWTGQRIHLKNDWKAIKDKTIYAFTNKNETILEQINIISWNAFEALVVILMAVVSPFNFVIMFYNATRHQQLIY